VATLAGFAPDAEQRMLLDLAFALDRNGKSLAFEFVLIAPRQNLKTGFLKQYALGQLFVRKESLVPWTAHEFSTAEEALNDLETLIDGSDVLRKRVAMTSRGNVAKRGAKPEIKLTRAQDNARLIFKTRTKGGGRGLSGRKVILDEAYALQSGQVGALYPIMSAQPDPQLVLASSACRPESAVLWDAVQRGRRGGHRRLVFVEWCAPSPEESCEAGEACSHARDAAGCACDNAEVLIGTHTAITRGRIDLQTLLNFRGSMPVEEYAREIMGWHDEISAADAMLDLTNWPNLASADAAMDGSPKAFAVAVSPDRKHVAIAAAGSSAIDPDRTHLELITPAPVVTKIVDRCKKLAEKWGWGIPFILDDHGPAASIIEELRKAGLVVIGLKSHQNADAVEQFVDRTGIGLYSHGPQMEVENAILGLKPRTLGDGRVVYGRKASESDITPVEAVTFAAWGVERGGAPQVWSLQQAAEELLAKRRAEAQEAAGELGTEAPPQEPGGVRFTRPDGVTFSSF
jgi:hypothetical protein